jgi:hypothetical protein
MCHPFQTYIFHMCYACETCRFKIIPFGIASECPRERSYEEMADSDSVKILAAWP